MKKHKNKTEVRFIEVSFPQEVTVEIKSTTKDQRPTIPLGFLGKNQQGGWNDNYPPSIIRQRNLNNRVWETKLFFYCISILVPTWAQSYKRSILS